ncbi:hypothetical protein AMET1_1367 [Methanonatronarchaeum thermophilum]|uniref:Uncharacterized protein n=1 Tax=Methanonatronarchaeum thermophilum TaxID=1927129 RepID=A0A1Y3GAH3_9EURY|nr:hypothetical protein [Methanonatronarchaeum thermophilum]OUJ18451.1 hypothetical protein AMET1_1367 [Methanonatronarchaeum thermophilum]
MSLKDKLMKKRAGVPMAGVFLLVILMVTAGGVGALMVHEGDKLATTEHNPIEFEIIHSDDVVTQGEWADAQANIENPHNATYTVTVDYFLEHNLDDHGVGLACNVTVLLPTDEKVNGDDLLETIYTSTHTLGMDERVLEDFKIIYHGPAVDADLELKLMGDVTVDKIHGPDCPIDEPVDPCVTSENFNLTHMVDGERVTLCIDCQTDDFSVNTSKIAAFGYGISQLKVTTTGQGDIEMTPKMTLDSICDDGGEYTPGDWKQRSLINWSSWDENNSWYDTKLEFSEIDDGDSELTVLLRH